jgi:tetratricopeptide (TPR) repeat protein
MVSEQWAGAELALGRHGELVGQLEALVRAHPYHERLWARLMVALYRSARPTDALQAYQRLRTLLGEELGLAPSPELQRLETAILGQDPDLELSARGPGVRAEPPKQESGPGGTLHPLPRQLSATQPTPLAGRALERTVLARSWRRSRQGGVQVVLLAGELGIGKTRLATEAAVDIQRQGGLVLYGSCEEDLAVPYQPFVEALRHLINTIPAAELAETAAEHGGELARLFPELTRLIPDLPAPQRADPETERYLLFSAVAELMGKLSCRRPTALVLDDLHWATKPTVLMLRHLIRTAEPRRLLIIGAYRDTDVGRGHPLTGLLAELWRRTEFEQVVLRGLSPDEAVTMVSDVVGKELPATTALARRVHAEAAGSPFFMAELVRHILETDLLGRDGDTWTDQPEQAKLGIPDSVRDIIRHRLSRLPELVEQILVRGAVVGREFDITFMGRLADLAPAQVLECLDAARRASLVREIEGSPGRYMFGHALIRRTLYDELGAARRMMLHRDVAETLEALAPENADPAELARHWAAALPAFRASPHDAARAARAAQRAGRSAMAALAYEEAVSRFEEALKAARQVEGQSHVCELLIELGEAQRCAGDAGHRATLLAAGELGHELGNVDYIARAALANQRGVYSRIGAVDVQRVAALRRALAAVGPVTSPVRAKLLAALATEVHFEGQHRLDLAREAVAAARLGTDEETVAQTLAALWFAAWGSTADGERQTIATELEYVAAGLSDRSLRFQASLCVFLTATGQGDIALADQALSGCVRLAEESGQPLLRWRVTSLRVHRAMTAGQFAQAEQLANESLILGETTGQPDRLPFVVTPMASMRLLQGRPAEAEALVTPMIERFPGVFAYPALLAWTLADAGRVDEAAAIIERLRIDRFAGVPPDYTWLFCICSLSRACYRIGHRAAAAELYDLLLPARGLMATTQSSWIGPVTHYLGVLASMLGQVEAAEAYFAEAVQLQEQIGARVTLTHSRIEWARTLLRTAGHEQDARARALLEAALHDAQQAVLPVIAATVQDLLRHAPTASAG